MLARTLMFVEQCHAFPLTVLTVGKARNIWARNDDQLLTPEHEHRQNITAVSPLMSRKAGPIFGARIKFIESSNFDHRLWRFLYIHYLAALSRCRDMTFGPPLGRG